MAQSWRVHIDSVLNLKETAYRFGDITKSVVHGMKKFVEGQDKSSDESKVFGDVCVEAQVGTVCKRTNPFKVSGESRLEVQETLLLPVPEPMEGMHVRVWRVNLGLQPDALVGDVTIFTPQALEDVAVHREGIREPRGVIRICVTPGDTSFVPVVSGDADSDAANPLDNLRKGVMGLRNKLARIDGADFQVLARRPLLNRTQEHPSIGDCTVVIEKIQGLASTVNEPYFVIGLDGQEFQADKFAHTCEADLTFKFEFSSLQNNLSIYCYDDFKNDRNRARGRILIPLATLLSRVGEVPPCSSLLKQPQGIGGTWIVQFMPVKGADGHGLGCFIDRFRPAIQGRKDFGMVKSQAFGSISLRIQLNFKPIMKTHLHCYVHAISDGACSKDTNRAGSESDVGEQQKEPSILDVLKSVDIDKVNRNANRLETCLESPAQGIVRWLRGGLHRGLAAGIAWFVFSVCGFFPPPNWAWPVYIWSAVVGNGYLVKTQRQRDWQGNAVQPFLVWDDDVVPETIQEAVNKFKKGVVDLDRLLETLVSFWERLLNIFSFADGMASILCVITSGVAAVTLSCTWFFWEFVVSRYVGSPTSWAFAVVGLILCVAISQSPPPKKEDDPLENIVAFNKLLQCVPDQQELAHRYIATRIQRNHAS